MDNYFDKIRIIFPQYVIHWSIDQTVPNKMRGDVSMQDKKKMMIAKTSNQLGFATLENEVVLDGLFS
jgi:hypothetical protein